MRIFKLLRPVVAVAVMALLLTACQTGGPAPRVSAADGTAPDMLEKVLPAVVTVAVYKTEKLGRVYGYSASKSDIAYGKTLNLSGAQSTGSGFIVEQHGKRYIVTNAHVIDQAADGDGSVSVFSITGASYPARVLGADTFYDVALLEFSGKVPDDEVAALSFSSHEPRIGERVFAIGNPLGTFPYTVTQGIIGGKNRVRGGVTGKFGYLQSSATTIWGNSGGPLVDAGGRVVGINSQIEVVARAAGTFVQPQLNFALESGIAQRVVNDIIAHGRVVRAFIGFTAAQSFDPDTGLQLGGSPRIVALLPGSPAASQLSGKEGYAIAAVNGETIRNVEELLGALEKIVPGGRVDLDLERDGAHAPVSLAAGELTAERQGELANFFLKGFASLRAAKEGDGLIVGNAKEECQSESAPAALCGRRALIAIYRTETDKFEEVNQFPGDLAVRAAGYSLSAKDGDTRLWRVSDGLQLAMALRLSVLGGNVALAGTMTEQDVVVALGFSDGQGALAKVVIY